MDLNTAFGAFKVDQDGVQIAHKMLMFQWQDGKKVIVWPEELAPGQAALPDAAVESAPVRKIHIVIRSLLRVLPWGCLCVTAWLGAAASTEAQPPIRIGVSVSMTGSNEVLSARTPLRGYQLCVKHANEKGGVLGRPVELVVEDDKSDVATAVRLYESLIGKKGGRGPRALRVACYRRRGRRDREASDADAGQFRHDELDLQERPEVRVHGFAVG